MSEELLVVQKRYHWPFLGAYGVALLLTTMQAGFSLGGSSFVQSIFQAQSDWTTGDQTMITSSSTLGLAIGSLCSGPLLGKGRRRTVLVGNAIVLCSFALQLEINVYLLALGKLMQGVGSGMVLSAASIMIPETVPTKLVGGFGSLVNLGVVLGLSAYMFLGLLVPVTPEGLATTQIWRYLFAIPAATAVVIILMFVAVFRQDTISFDIVNNNEKDALALIKRIYQPTSDRAHNAILREYV